ncbi:rhomboid family intramembrane serine protease, partial [Streptococcus pseudopneumoniae]
ADVYARFWDVTGIVIVKSAVGTFFLNEPGTVTVGASGLVFGYFGYLAVAAFFARTWSGRITRGIISLVVIGVYGSAMLF